MVQEQSFIRSLYLHRETGCCEVPVWPHRITNPLAFPDRLDESLASRRQPNQPQYYQDGVLVALSYNAAAGTTIWHIWRIESGLAVCLREARTCPGVDELQLWLQFRSFKREGGPYGLFQPQARPRILADFDTRGRLVAESSD